MSQSKAGSLCEVVVNILMGWSVSSAANMFISIDVPDLGNPETN